MEIKRSLIYHYERRFPFIEKDCEKLHATVDKHEIKIKELILEISSLKQEINYMTEMIDALADSVEGNYFIE